MKRIVVAVLFLLPLSVAHADDASKRTKVQELFTLLHVDQISGQILSNLNRQMQTLGSRQIGATPTPEQKKQFDDFQGRIDGLVEQTIGWKTIQPDFAKLYTDTYTEPEIDSFLAFYKSPAGQTMLAKSPELANKSIQLTQQRMAGIEPQLRQMVADFVKQTTPSSSAPPSLNSLPPSTTPAPSSSSPSTPPKK